MGADSTEIHGPIRDSGVILFFEYIREASSLPEVPTSIPKSLTTKKSPYVQDAVALVTAEIHATSATIRTSTVQGIGLAVLPRLLLEHLTGELNQTLLFPSESNC